MTNIYLKIDCILHWGWRLNLVPFSKSRPPLRILPPTTLIGAFAFPINRALNLPETYGESSGAERLRQSLKYVGYRINSPLIEYSDLSKISFLDRRRGEAKTDAVAIGKTYAFSSFKPPEVTLCYVIDESKISSIISGSIEGELLKAACSIVRLGSRESTIVPLRISLPKEAKVIDSKSGETSFSFMEYMTTSVEGSYIASQVVDWRQEKIGDYRKAKFSTLIVPYDVTKFSSEKVKVKLADGYVFYDIDGELVIGMK